jgi:hypothetical protein
MKLELAADESRELLALIVDRLLDGAGLADADRAALRRWRSESMLAGSDGMKELTGKVNADIDRALKTKEKSAVMKPDWR